MWSNKYIGIPYKANGRDLDGVDCWGLAYLVYREQFNIELPSFSSNYVLEDRERIKELIARYEEGWEEITSPEEGTLVLFRIAGEPTHIGIAVSDTQFIHSREDCDVAVENFANFKWSKRIVGYYKYTNKTNAVLNLAPHPLRTQNFTENIAPGTTVQELVDLINKKYEVADGLKSITTVMINGEVVPKDNWNRTIQEGDSVEYRAVPAGDAGRMILMIAVAIAAPYAVAAMGSIGGVALVTATGSLTIAGSIAVAGLTMLGSALVNVIAPIRPPAEPRNPAQSERQLMVTGGSNQANPYGAIPVVLGRVRMTPPIGAINYIRYQNERDSYLNMLLVWGYGPLSIDESTFKIGETSITNFTNVNSVTLNRITEPTSTQQANFDAIYGSDIAQNAPNTELTCAGDPNAIVSPGTWVTTSFPATTAQKTNFTVSIHFPQGLRKIQIKGEGAGNEYSAPVTFRIEYNVGGNWNSVDAPVIGAGAVKVDGFTWSNQYNFPATTNALSVRVRRETGDSEQPSNEPNFRYSHTSILNTVTIKTNETPAKDPPSCKIAKTALTIQASEQFNNQIQGINAIVQTYCLTWNGSAWVMGTSNNPAALFRYILQHPANPRRVLDSEVADKIDLQKIQYWHTYCNTKGFTFNAIVADRRSVLEVLRDICAAGRASPGMIDGKWTVNIDEPKTVIVQHFTPHNSWGFEGSRVLPRQPDALRVNFYDEDKEFQESEIIVAQPGKTAETAELFENITLPGVTKKSAAIDHARWHIAQAKLRPEIYNLNTDIEYLVCNRGDRVKVTHDVPMWGLGSGRIKNAISTSIFELDEYVTIEPAKSYVIRVRSASGASVEKAVITQYNISSISRTNNIVTITLTNTHALSVGDIVSVTSANSSINDATAKVTAVTSSSFSYSKIGLDIVTTTAGGTIALALGSYSKIKIVGTASTTEIAPEDLFLFGESLKEAQDLIILNIEPTSNKTAKLTLIDYGVTQTYNLFNDYTNLSATTVFDAQISLPPLNTRNTFADADKPLITNIYSNNDAATLLSPGNYQYNIKVTYVNNSITLNSSIEYVECQYDLATSVDTLNVKTVTVGFTAGSITIPNVVQGVEYKVRLRYLNDRGVGGPWTAWTTHTVQGFIDSNNVTITVSVDRTRRYLNIEAVTTGNFIPDDFKYFEYKVYKNQGTGDFWQETDEDIKTTVSAGPVSFNLREFPKPRLSLTGTKYRVACRMVDTTNTYVSSTALTEIIITSLV